MAAPTMLWVFEVMVNWSTIVAKRKKERNKKNAEKDAFLIALDAFYEVNVMVLPILGDTSGVITSLLVTPTPVKLAFPPTRESPRLSEPVSLTACRFVVHRMSATRIVPLETTKEVVRTNS